MVPLRWLDKIEIQPVGFYHGLQLRGAKPENGRYYSF